MLLRERALAPSWWCWGPPRPAARTGASLPRLCQCYVAALGLVHSLEGLAVIALHCPGRAWAAHALCLSTWHLQAWHAVGLGAEPTSGAGFGARTFGSCTEALREGLGSSSGLGRREPLCLHVAGSPSVSRWRCVPGLVPTGRGLRGGGSHLAFPGLPPDCRQGAPADARLSPAP